MNELIAFCSITGFLTFIAIGTIIVDVFYTKNLNKENKDFEDELKNI